VMERVELIQIFDLAEVIKAEKVKEARVER